MRYTIRWFYLLKLTVVVAAVAVAVYFLHDWQVDEQRGAFLRQADRAKEQNPPDPAAEADYLNRYLTARPDDDDVRERLGRLLVAQAEAGLLARAPGSGRQLQRAYLILDDTLRRDPDRDNLRRFAADTAMKLGLFPEAQAHLAELIKKQPGDGELEYKAARALELAGDNDKAVQRYKAAIAKKPDLVDAYHGLAALHRRQNRPDDADAVVAALLTANPNSAKANVTAAQYLRTFGKRPQLVATAARPIAAAKKLPAGETVGGAIGRLLSAARAAAPDELDVLLLSALDYQAQAQEAAEAGSQGEMDRAVGEARKSLARATELYPQAAGPRLALTNLEGTFRSPAEAAAAAAAAAAALPGSVDLTASLFDAQVKAGDAAGAEQSLAKLKAAGIAEGRLAYAQARIQGLRDEWEAAAAGLAKVIAKRPPDLANDPAFARQVQLTYARCLDQLGDPERRLEAYRAAVPPDPNDPAWATAQFGVAEALAAVGRTDEALAAFRRLADKNPAVWLPVARLELAKVLRVADAKKRDWGSVEQALGRAEKEFPRAVEVALLRADVLHHKGDPAAARKVLTDLRTANPKVPALWVAAALQDLRDKDPVRAEQTLDQAKAAAGDSAELRLARARVYADAKAPDLGDKLVALADGAEALSKPQQRRLFRGLAEVATAAGQPAAAGRLLDRSAAVQGYSLPVHLARYDAAARAGDEALMDRVAADVRRVDGENGAYTRLVAGLSAIYRAQKKDDRTALAAAQAGLEAVEKERPDWARAALALAVILDLQRNPDAALTRYQKAVEGGEAPPDAIRRLAELFLAKGQKAQAEAAFAKLPPGYADRPEMATLVANLTVGTDPKKALAAAERAVPADSKDVAGQLWLAQIALAAKDPAKAEAAARRAVLLKPDVPALWLTLIGVQAQGGPDGKAEAAKTVAEAEGKIPPADRPVFAAQAAVQLGRWEDAAEKFKKAREERPADLKAVRAEADYLFQLGRLADARAAFERVLALKDLPPDERSAATRMLAVCLAADRDPETSRKALQLLGYLSGDELKAPPPGETPVQRRTRATILALQKDRASKEAAAKLLEEALTALDPPDLFLLAQLQQALGNRNGVRVAMAALLSKADSAPVYLGWYAAWLLKNGDPDAAAPLVEKLAGLRPDAPQTAELQARLFVARRKPDEARKVLAAQVEKPGASAAAYARLAEDLGLYDDAERLYRRAADQAKAAQPAATLPLAAFLGRRGRVGEALAQVEEARAKVPATIWGPVAVGVLYAAKSPPAAELGRVVGWLEEATKTADGPTRAALNQLQASVRNLQGDYPAAAELYQRAIAANDRDVIALNNLAYLRSVNDKQHEEALKLVGRARRWAGSHPDVVDTEAMILLQMGKPEEAVARLKGVAAEAPSASAYFHLAQAELAAGRRPEAVSAWRQAVQLGLSEAELHPLERPEFARLTGLFK
ncbi:MAG: tetratricopeptide repeat protein [Gemmataceae bacterium]|nr:tetratricopeptide repeat protein [Gemmataceae bacterium]